MRRIALMSQKGGSGKTTTTVNLAAVLGETGKRVLLIDLDPQANATEWLGMKNDRRDLLEVFTDGRDLATLIRPTTAKGVDLIPSSEWLSGAEKGVAGEIGAEVILRRALDGLPPRWDVVFIDGQPSLGFLVISALAACHEVLVAVEASALALSGLAAVLRNVERVRERLNPEIRLAGLLACRVDARQRHDLDVVETMRERFGETVFHTVIRANCRLKEAPSFGKAITEYSPRSTGAQDYRAAAAELVTRGAAELVTRTRKGPKTQQQQQGKR
jgi:chromosome partitioning protein